MLRVPGVAQLALSPVLLLFSVPLILFGIATTAFACSILSARALLIYVDLVVIFLKSGSFTFRKHKAERPKFSHGRSRTSSSGSITPRIYSEAGPFTMTVGARDYEGVGGWREQGSDEDSEGEQTWLGASSRLELPTMVLRPTSEHRHHHRSNPGSFRTSMSGSGSGQRSSSRSTLTRPKSMVGFSFTSPDGEPRRHLSRRGSEDYMSFGTLRVPSSGHFGLPSPNIARPREIRKKSDTSSSSGGSSQITMTGPTS